MCVCVVFFPPEDLLNQGHWGIGQELSCYFIFLLTRDTTVTQSPHPQSINISLRAVVRLLSGLRCLRGRFDEIEWEVYFLIIFRECFLFWGGRIYAMLDSQMTSHLKMMPPDFQYHANFGMSLLKCETWNKLTPAKFLQCSLSSALKYCVEVSCLCIYCGK